jgi:hypothetical protein
VSLHHATSQPCPVLGRENIELEPVGHTTESTYNATKPCILHSSNEGLIASFAGAMSDLASCYKRRTSYDSRQLSREVRDLVDCFTKLAQSQAGVIASSSLLLIK